jgi:hypothetical protein
VSLEPLAAGTVMPGVHAAAAASPAPQTVPMPLVEPVQFDPLQHRLGCPVPFGVHVSPEAHCARESQRQPWLPAMQVEVTPPPAPRPPELLPELPLELPLDLQLDPAPEEPVVLWPHEPELHVPPRSVQS